MDNGSQVISSKRHIVRSHLRGLWPAADLAGWEEACRPGRRLVRGGGASHLKKIVQDDLARRYGYFLDFLCRHDRLDPAAGPAEHVTLDAAADYISELKARVSSVTLYGSICKLRRAAELIAPGSQYPWLREIEKDLAFVMVPKSKRERVVLASVLVEAGLTQVEEAETSIRTPIRQATQVRDGLMVALLAMIPVRLKNFSALAMGETFVNVDGHWWVMLAGIHTKEQRPDERRVHQALMPALERYLSLYRPILARRKELNALWLSALNGASLTEFGVEGIIHRSTLKTVGIDISPHLFRACAATTAATLKGDMPYLGSGLLNHRDRQTVAKHYNFATGLNAAQTYASIIESY